MQQAIAELAGLVRDPQGQPLDNVLVQQVGGAAAQTGSTADGHFTLQVPAGPVSLAA
jgi:hypothetical protein